MNIFESSVLEAPLSDMKFVKHVYCGEHHKKSHEAMPVKTHDISHFGSEGPFQNRIPQNCSSPNIVHSFVLAALGPSLKRTGGGTPAAAPPLPPPPRQARHHPGQIRGAAPHLPLFRGRHAEESAERPRLVTVVHPSPSAPRKVNCPLLSLDEAACGSVVGFSHPDLA